MKIESKVCCEDVSAGKIKEDKVEKKETQRGNLDREEKILKSLALWVKTGCKNIAPCQQSFSLPAARLWLGSQPTQFHQGRCQKKRFFGTCSQTSDPTHPPRTFGTPLSEK